MRIIGFPKSPSKSRFHSSRWSRFWLPAAFVGILISLFAFPVNAQSSSFVGCRITDEEFGDRLHHNVDWLAALDFQATDDRWTSRLESAEEERVVKALGERAEFSLENEILDSVCEVFHLNACEGFQGLWAPGSLEVSEGLPQNPGGGFDVEGIANDSFRRLVLFVGDSRNLLVRNWHDGKKRLAQIAELVGFSTLVLDLQQGLAESDWVFDRVLQVWNTENAQVGTTPKVRTYWANFATNLRWLAGHLEVPVASWATWRKSSWTGSRDLSWPAGLTFSAANFGTSPFDWSVMHRHEPPIQPIPAASYVGLERAIDFGFGQVKLQIDRWRNRGRRVAAGADWLAKLQKEAFERVVLKQFDAIVR